MAIIGGRIWGLRGALLLSIAAPLQAQAPYVPDVTEAREKEWRKLVAAAQAAYASGKAADGIDPARKGLALADELFGPDDPRTLISVNDLALQLEAAGHFPEAETLFRRVFDSYLRTRGEDDPNAQLALENLIDFYVARKRYDVAAPLAGYALSSFRRMTGEGSARSRRMAEILAAMPSARMTVTDDSTGGQAAVTQQAGVPPTGDNQPIAVEKTDSQTVSETKEAQP